MVCGDFNARCGELMEVPEALPRHQVLDVVKNRQGEDLMDFLENTGMTVVNGGWLYFVDCPRGRVPIQKDRDVCLFASFGCSSENGSHSWKGEGRSSPNPNPNYKGCFLLLI